MIFYAIPYVNEEKHVYILYFTLPPILVPDVGDFRHSMEIVNFDAL